MIDLGISKMALIGAVALIVIGPEKLPRVARTLGTLLGKAQRYISDVKQEVNRSMELDEFKKMKESVQDAARDVENSIKTSASDFEKSWTDTNTTASSDSLPGFEIFPQAGRDAAVVQGPRRRAHQSPVGCGTRGPFSPAIQPQGVKHFS